MTPSSSSRILARRTVLRSLACAAVLASASTAPAFERPAKAIEALGDDLKAVIPKLEFALARATAEVRSAAADALSALRSLVESLEELIRSAVHTLTDALSTALRDVMAQVDALLAEIKGGVIEAIQEAARALRAAVDQVFAQMSAIVDETLRQAENLGGRLFVRVGGEVRVWLASLLGVGLAMTGAVGVARQLRRDPGGATARRSPAALAVLAVLTVGGTGLALGSGSISSALGSTVELPDGHAICKEASGKGAALRAALAEPTKLARALQAGPPREVGWFVSPKEWFECNPSKRVAPVAGRNFFPPVLPGLSAPSESGAFAESPVLAPRLPLGPSNVPRSPPRGAFPMVRDDLPIRPIFWSSSGPSENAAHALGEATHSTQPARVHQAKLVRAHAAMFETGTAALAKACNHLRADVSLDALGAVVRGGRARRIVDQVQEVATRNRVPRSLAAAPGQAQAAPSTQQQRVNSLADEVKNLSTQCIANAPTRQEADQARELYVLAADYLGEPIRCVADRDCPDGALCRVASGDCMARGFYCRSPNDCRAGSECDAQHEECITRDAFACQRSDQCRAGEACFGSTRRCVDIEAFEGQPCTVTDAARYNGLCFTQPGLWASVDGDLECRPSYTPHADDQCDGKDNDCDGITDEQYRPGEACTTTDPNVFGDCTSGTKECRDGRERCRASSPKPAEVCEDGKDNTCDGATDEGCRTPRPEICNGVDDDFNGAVDDATECHTVVLLLDEIDDDAYLWHDAPGRTEDALCSAQFKVGHNGKAECNLSAIARARPLPESGRFALKFGNGGCFGSGGVATLVINGNVVWTKTKSHGTRHCGWFYRKIFDIDFKHGTFVDGPENECFNDGDCRD